MKFLYNIWILKYFILICRACIVYGELVYIGQKDILTTSHTFILVKNVCTLMKLIQDQVKSIDAGSMFRRWEAISMNSKFTSFTEMENHWNFEIFRHSFDVMKLILLKSCDFGSLIHSAIYCFETNDLQKVWSFTKQCFESPITTC